MKFLSREEQECLQFFEETIDSLEESLEENDLRVGQVKPLAIGSGRFEEVDGPPTSSPKPGVILSSPLANPLSPKEDIIDLVQPEPDLVPTRELIFNPTSPGSVNLLYESTTWMFQSPCHSGQDLNSGEEI